jgi:hypothetical protein
MPTGQSMKGLVSSSIGQSSTLRRNWSRDDAAGRERSFHVRAARCYLEKQPAEQRQADRPANEEGFDVGHQTRLLASAMGATQVGVLRVLILE